MSQDDRDVSRETFSLGPWIQKLLPHGTRQAPFAKHGDRFVYSGDGTVIAFVLNTKSNAKPNAQMFAAAPELYEAVWRFIDLYDNPIDGLYDTAMSVARSALAKANGEKCD